MNIVVVDDFYENPEAVRSLALKAEYQDVTRLNYPGFQSLKTFSSASLVSKFEIILGRSLNIRPDSLTFGRFIIMLKETGSRLKVHLDGAADWTGVLYLNPTEDGQGGTAFYRHRETGIDGPIRGQSLFSFGYNSWEDMEKTLIEKDTLNPEAWEETAFVATKFNRLVLFRGNELFHCHTHSFGSGREDGRMTQNFFFNERRE
jgi:hypothetical protein